MKKTLSMFLAAVLLFTMLPFNVLAEEDYYSLTREEHLALACEIFPEYADSILGRNTLSTTYSRSVKRDIVVCETRDVSEQDKMTYVQYSDGSTLVASSRVQEFTPSMTIVDISGSGSSSYTVDLRVSSYSSSQEFIVKSVKFQLNYNGYDCITNAGNISHSTTINNGAYIAKAWENASGPAYIVYSAEFQPRDNSLPISTRIEFHVGSNNYQFIAG